jgi:hypothetical protein
MQLVTGMIQRRGSSADRADERPASGARVLCGARNGRRSSPRPRPQRHEEDLQHPLVEIGEQIHRLSRREFLPLRSAGRWSIEFFQAEADGVPEAFAVEALATVRGRRPGGRNQRWLGTPPRPRNFGLDRLQALIRASRNLLSLHRRPSQSARYRRADSTRDLLERTSEKS